MSNTLKSIQKSRESDDKNTTKIQSNVIVTATMLGFIETRFHLRQPFCFFIEHPNPENFEQWLIDKESKIFHPIKEKVSTLIDSKITEKVSKEKIQQIIHEAYEDSKEQFQEIWGNLVGSLIKDSFDRDLQINKMPVRQSIFLRIKGLVDALLNCKLLSKKIDNKVSQEVIEEVFSEIYYTDKVYSEFLKEYHEFENVINAMSVVLDKTDPCIGNYLKDSQSKAWHPDELITTGKAITKTASCFACCTYMYVAGYTPSSINLGRAESWVPHALEIQKSGQQEDLIIEYNPEIASPLLTKWHREVYDYMMHGLSILDKGFEFMSKRHQASLNDLREKLEDEEIKKHISTRGGNLFLDAITVHQSDWKRIRDTLKPAIEQLKIDSFSLN